MALIHDPTPTRRRSRMAGLVRGVALIAAAVAAIAVLAPDLPSLNPFATETKDRSQPVLLQSLERLSEYRAASANLQVVVDVEEDATMLPSFIKGSKTLFVAAGQVDASVDFGAVGDDRLEVSPDRRAVTVTLPRPELSEPRLDLRRSRVFDRDRGLVDRVAGALSDDADEQRALFGLAERKLLEAARGDRRLLQAAERNTRTMLEGMLRGLGFERVAVRYADSAAGQ